MRATIRGKILRQSQSGRGKMVRHLLKHDSLLKTLIEGSIEVKNISR